MTIQCCKDCQDRHPKCHGECERYLDAKARLETEKEARKKERMLDDALAEIVVETRERWRRGKK